MALSGYVDVFLAVQDTFVTGKRELTRDIKTEKDSAITVWKGIESLDSV